MSDENDLKIGFHVEKDQEKAGGKAHLVVIDKEANDRFVDSIFLAFAEGSYKDQRNKERQKPRETVKQE
jgi:hypothetical protein